MTVEDKVLWAMFMASTDISEYDFDFYDMDEYETARVRENGLHMYRVIGEDVQRIREYILYPMKFYYPGKLDILALVVDDDKLIQSLWVPPDEYIVEALRQQHFQAPWASEREIGNILIAKWGENWDSDSDDE